MANYRVEVSATAEKQIRKLEQQERIRILRAIGELAHDRRPSGCRRLAGFDDVWRIRVGVMRVIYSVEDARLIVIVLKVGHRKEVYR